MQEKMESIRTEPPSIGWSHEFVPRQRGEESEKLWHIAEPLAVRYAPDGTLTYANDAYCTYYRQERRSVLGRNFVHRVPMDDLLRISRAVTMLSPFAPSKIIYHDVILPDGRVRRHVWLHKALFRADGSMREYVAVGMDVTGIQKNENLAPIEQRLQHYNESLCGQEPQEK